MLIDKELKRTTTKIPGDVPQTKKSKQQQLFGVLNEDEPEVTLPAAPLKVKKSILKDTEIQIPPHKMGIQTLREVLEDAKHKQQLSANDSFAYTKLLVEWMTAKGNAEIKKEKR